MGTTERTTSNPYARHTLSHLQDEIAVIWYGASSFSSGLSSARQTQILQVIEDGNDRIAAEAFGHRPWWRRTIAAGLTLVTDQATYAMPADFRRMISLKETIGGKTRDVAWVPEDAWEQAWGDELVATHPWGDEDSIPRWFGRGFSSDNPPVYIIERQPTPTATENGGKLYPLYRPYDGDLTNDTYHILPPAGRRALKHYAKMILAANDGDEQQFAIHERLFQREVVVLQQHEGVVSEQPQQLQLPADFIEEIQDP